MIKIYGLNGSASSAYICFSGKTINQVKSFTPIGSMLTNLLNKLAWEYPALRTFAHYFLLSNILGSGGGYMRKWEISIYSNEIRGRIESGQLSNGIMWDEWSIVFH